MLVQLMKLFRVEFGELGDENPEAGSQITNLFGIGHFRQAGLNVIADGQQTPGEEERCWRV